MGGAANSQIQPSDYAAMRERNQVHTNALQTTAAAELADGKTFVAEDIGLDKWLAGKTAGDKAIADGVSSGIGSIAGAFGKMSTTPGALSTKPAGSAAGYGLPGLGGMSAAQTPVYKAVR